jgi:hypothetical protein
MTPGPHPLIWVGFLAFFVAALVVGVRLVLLARRTRRLPELCIGVGVLGIGPVGFGFYVFAQQLGVTSPLHALLTGTGMLAVAAGVCCKFVFNWRVYHPASNALRLLAVAVVLAHVITFAYQGLGPGFAAYNELNWSYYLRILLQIGALLWGSAEALRYWGLMRRRTRVGLADPVVTNRFLLWGIGAGAAGVGSLIGTVAQVVLGAPSYEVPWVLASSSAHGLVAALAMWLAFLPPAAWTRLVQRRATAAAP